MAYRRITATKDTTPPQTIEEALAASNIRVKKRREAARWWHVQIIYIIWCLYTKSRWGGETLSNTGIRSYADNRLTKELEQLKFNIRQKSQKVKNVYKWLFD